MKEKVNPHTKARVEYIHNLDQSDYVVAVRRGGNCSKRFYEALNWGRIPVFIDTDCVLPYDFAIDWNQYCVWVDHSEIKYATEKIVDFHNELSNDDFIELQRGAASCGKNGFQWMAFISIFKNILDCQMNRKGSAFEVPHSN